MLVFKSNVKLPYIFATPVSDIARLSEDMILPLSFT